MCAHTGYYTRGLLHTRTSFSTGAGDARVCLAWLIRGTVQGGGCWPKVSNRPELRWQGPRARHVAGNRSLQSQQDGHQSRERATRDQPLGSPAPKGWAGGAEGPGDPGTPGLWSPGRGWSPQSLATLAVGWGSLPSKVEDPS